MPEDLLDTSQSINVRCPKLVNTPKILSSFKSSIFDPRFVSNMTFVFLKIKIQKHL